MERSIAWRQSVIVNAARVCADSNACSLPVVLVIVRSRPGAANNKTLLAAASDEADALYLVPGVHVLSGDFPVPASRRCELVS